MRISQCIALLFLLGMTFVISMNQWSFQASLTVPQAYPSYGKSPAGIFGRGFITLISGYEDGSTPGVFVHTTDTGYVDRTTNHYVWSQQATLVAADSTSDSGFGKWMVYDNQTILIAAPNLDSSRYKEIGGVYVFNGTLRHWTQMQKLSPRDAIGYDHFGAYMSLSKDRVLIGAAGQDSSTGAAYIYTRNSTQGLFWSRHSKLMPRDAGTLQYFAETLSLYGDAAVIGARNDYESGQHSGSAYVFNDFGGQWSQQQKLIADDLIYNQPSRDVLQYGKVLPVKFFGDDLAMGSFEFAAGIRRVDGVQQNIDTVYVFNSDSTTYRWSLQQKLFRKNDTDHLIMERTRLLMKENNLFATVYGGNVSASYLFRSFGSGWSLQQRLLSYNTTFNATNSLGANFTTPSFWGGTLLYSSGNNTQLIYSRYHNTSCLLIWMSDHFGDGWDTAVLTVRAPDLSNDTFHPHCDQVDPFFVRYCPMDPLDEGEYIIKVFAAEQARFFWEISWQVYVENTGVWYRGDFSSKMIFNFNATSMVFSFTSGENLIDLNAPCYRCQTIAFQSWAEQQNSGGFGFWPLMVKGAPYYISDYQARTLYFLGKVCDDIHIYQCYQTLINGVYILRLGGGLFGREIGFPEKNATWEGCGESGTDRDQFIFQIENGVCRPIAVNRYTWRCYRPNPVGWDSTPSPTKGGTVAPTQNVFGPPYSAGNMYSVDPSQPIDHSNPLLNPSLPRNDVFHEVISKMKDGQRSLESQNEKQKNIPSLQDWSVEDLFLP